MFCKKSKSLLLLIFLSFVLNSQEIKIPVGEDSLSGTLLYSKSKFLCIFHSGSGPTDRDGNSELGLESNYIKKIADSLYKHEISSFRYDKRGIGKSKDLLVSEDSLTIFDYVKDLDSVINYFTKPPYRYKSFVLIGHSEGALIVTLSAQKNNCVKKLILIAGAGFRADTVIKRQLNHLVPDAKKVIFPMLDSLAAGKRIDNVPPILSSLFRESVQNYMISWLKIDPAIELSKTKQKALIVQGDNDIQVGVKDAHRLKEFKKDAEIKIIPNMNHVLVETSVVGRKENMETYNNPALPLHKELFPVILDFIKK